MKMRIAAGLAISLALSPSGSRAYSPDVRDLFTAGIIEPSEQAIDRIANYRPPLTPLAIDSQKTWDRALLDGNDEALDEEFYRLVAAQGMDRGAEQMLGWGVTRHLAGYLRASERYGRDLKDIGALTGQPSLEEASVGVWFYLYAVTLADGHKCTDPSAPRQFMANAIEAYGSMHFAAAKLEHATLVRLASDAVALEALTATDRVADPTICLAETSGAEMKPLGPHPPTISTSTSRKKMSNSPIRHSARSFACWLSAFSATGSGPIFSADPQPQPPPPLVSPVPASAPGSAPGGIILSSTIWFFWRRSTTKRKP